MLLVRRGEVNVSRITLLDFGVDERGNQFAKLEFVPLIGEPKDATVFALRKGDSMTTDVPIVNPTGDNDGKLAHSQ